VGAAAERSARARRLLLLLLPPLLLACLTPLLAGCAGVSDSHHASPIGRRLSIYSSLPLHGPLAGQAQAVLDGERLALQNAHRRVGRFRIDLISLDDSGPGGIWSPSVTAANAKLADQSPTTISYIGDYDSGATAVSLPANNLAGILQVSPMSPYVGLTSSFEAGQGDPERFYPTGTRNFIRLAPGEAVQAAAQVALMRALHVRSVYVLADGNPFSAPLASILASDAKLAGIRVAGEQSVELDQADSETRFTAQVEQAIGSGAEAIFLDGEAGEGAASLWRQLHAADPRLLLLGASALANRAFAAAIGPAARRSYLTTPALSLASYGPAAQRVFAQVRAHLHVAPSPYDLYGYAAMELVLSAIRRAGRHGDDRAAVVAGAFAIQRIDSVLGRYSVLSDGETTIARYGVDRIAAGRPVFWREMPVRDGAPYYQHVP
jgi:branched-chain amino acid transport system substrate-binding protein